MTTIVREVFMEDPIHLAVVLFALVLLVFILPAALYAYMTRRKVAWRKKINVGWRKHATEKELRRAACGETRKDR